MALTLFSLFSCKGFENLSPEDFAKRLSEDASIQLVDVRTPEEYAEGHLALAANIDWNADGFLDKAVMQLGKDCPVYVYCRSGRRSAAAASALSKKGYKVTNMLGGYLAWTEAGKPVTRYEVERFLTDSGRPVERV